MKSESRIGFVLGDTQRGVDTIIASGAYPAITTIHNSVKHAIQLHEHLGNDCIIVLRMMGSEHVIDHGFALGKRPAEIGKEWFETTRPAMAAAPFAYFMLGGPGFNSDDPVYADFYADIVEDAMRRMHQEGYKGAVLCFYEGNPHTLSDGSGIDGWAPYWDVVNLAAQYGFLLGPQGYWVNGKMDMSDDWHNFRLLRVLRDYPGKFPPGTRFFKQEGGIDLQNGLGWKSAGCGKEGFIKGLKKEDEIWRTARLPEGVEFIGTTLFALHDDKGKDTHWPDFNLWEVFPALLEHIKSLQTIVEAPVPTPEPSAIPLPADMMEIETTSPTGQNIRAHHSLAAPIVGSLDYGAVGYIHKTEAKNLGKQDTWCYVIMANGSEGWCGAWLLAAA